MDQMEQMVLRIIQDIIKKREKEKRTPLCALDNPIVAAAYRQYGMVPEVTADVLKSLVSQGIVTMRPVINSRSYYVNDKTL